MVKNKRVIERSKITCQQDTEARLFNFTFDEAYNYFLSAKKSEGIRLKTIKSYEEHFRFFKTWLNENYPRIKLVNDLNLSIVREYVNYMLDDHFNFKTKELGLSHQTINARIRFLKNFYNLLFAEEIVNKNYLEQVSLLKVDEHQFQLLSEDEMNRLLSVPNVNNFPQFRDLCLMYLFYDSAMRANEVFNLEVSEINFKNRTIVIPPEKNKTRKSKFIPISNHVVKLLMELISENKTHFDSDYVFLNWYGEKMSDDTFRRSLKRYLEKANITKSFTLHDFRRQAITEMLREGASVFAVQSIVGHSQISTTRKYVRFSEEDLISQHEKYSPVVKMRIKRRR